MFFPWKRRTKPTEPNVFDIIIKKENYPVNRESVELFFEAVKKYPLPNEAVLSIREEWMSLYRSYSSLLESLDLVSVQLKEKEQLLNNFNQGFTQKAFHLDQWLTDEHLRRISYTEFIFNLTEIVDNHLDTLSALELSISKVRFESIVHGLYTLYYDCLNIAELHLRTVLSLTHLNK